jgi:hypothetical protein
VVIAVVSQHIKTSQAVHFFGILNIFSEPMGYFKQLIVIQAGHSKIGMNQSRQTVHMPSLPTVAIKTFHSKIFFAFFV